MQTRRLRAEQLRGICVCAIASMVALASAVAPARAEAAAPVLEYVAPGSAFPIDFTAEGGEVTAALDGFNTVVHCTESEGEGEITGSRSTESHYAFKGCETQGGTQGGKECESGGASAKEIVSEEIEAELVYLDQAKHEVAMLLNPGGGNYMSFECEGEAVEARGPFLSPVDPINEMASSFEAVLERSGAQQIPSEYEGASGEMLEAIPTGVRGDGEDTTGVDLAFTIQPSTPLEIKAVSAEEVEVEQRQEEEAAAQKRQEEEAAARQRQAEEAAAAAARKRREEATAAKQRRLRALAAKRRQRARAKAKRRRVSARRLSKALKRCRKLDSKRRRIRCVRRARKKYSGHRGNKKHKAHRRHHSAVKSS